MLKKSKLGIESKELNELLDDLQKKRDDYCEVTGEGQIKEKTFEDAEQGREVEAKVMYFLKASLVVNRLLDLNELANTKGLNI